MVDGTEHEGDYMMQNKYQMHRRYCPSQSCLLRADSLIFSPKRISLNLAPDLFHRDHSAATAYQPLTILRVILSAASLQYLDYTTLYGAAIPLVFSTHTSHFFTFSYTSPEHHLFCSLKDYYHSTKAQITHD